jgi:hypothetical protein
MDPRVKEFVVQIALSADEKFIQEIKDITFRHIESLLATKGAEYSRKVNRLENFLAGASMDRTTPEKALYDMMKKHWLSIQKFTNELADGIRHDSVQWAEKTDDMITYLILLRAMVVKRQELETAISLQENARVLEQEELQRGYDNWENQIEDDDYINEERNEPDTFGEQDAKDKV